jgi:hypothetical protein
VTIWKPLQAMVCRAFVAGFFGHDTPFAYFQTKPGAVMQARHKKKSFLYWIKLPGLEIASFFFCVCKYYLASYMTRKTLIEEKF